MWKFKEKKIDSFEGNCRSFLCAIYVQILFDKILAKKAYKMDVLMEVIAEATSASWMRWHPLLWGDRKRCKVEETGGDCGSNQRQLDALASFVAKQQKNSAKALFNWS